MGADRRVAGANVRSLDHRPYIVERHTQLTQTPDHLRRRYLRELVAPIPGVGVDLRGGQQTDLVVMAQRLDAHERHPREVADADERAHAARMKPPVTGESSATIVLARTRSLRCEFCSGTGTCSAGPGRTFTPARSRASGAAPGTRWS